jgi:arylsulfatase A-like enzyme
MHSLKNIAIIAAAICLACTSYGKLANSKPNIILIMTDDQGYPVVGKHGHPWIKTPNMDALHDTSTRFTRFLVSPTCAPTRSALMTGRHPMRNGITHTILERERMALDAITLPQSLSSAGYQSGIFGKWHLGDEHEYQPDQRGFNETFIHGAGGIGQAFGCSCADVPKNKYFNPVIRHNGSFVKTEGYCTDLFFNAALGWIKKQNASKTPFFAYISTNAPHGPFIAPKKYAKRFTDLGFPKRQAGYYGMVENIDENIGRMMAKLEQWEMLKNTVIIFMSDNGMTHNGSGKLGAALGTDKDGKKMHVYNKGMKGTKGSTDEGGVRVPFFIRWDNKIKAGKDIEMLAGQLDLFPTLAALAGAEINGKLLTQVEGRSLLPLIEEDRNDWKSRFFFNHQGRWKTGADPDQFKWQQFSVRNQDYRLVASGNVNKTGKLELFHIASDPGQKKDIASQNPELVESMRKAYSAWWDETRPLMVNENVPISKTKPYHVWYKKQLKEQGIPTWTPPKL